MEGLFVLFMGFNIQPAVRFNPTPGLDWLSKLSNTDEWFDFDAPIPWIMIGGSYKRRYVTAVGFTKQYRSAYEQFIAGQRLNVHFEVVASART
jgi:hypothetical protein